MNAGPRGADGELAVKVVGYADEHGIDAALGQSLLEVLIGEAIELLPFGCVAGEDGG